MPEIVLFFDDGTRGKLPCSNSTEMEVTMQMKRPKGKRLYIYGIDFSMVDKIEVI